MAAPPEPVATADTGAETLIAGTDSSFDASAFEQSLDRRPPQRWIGWRLHLPAVATPLRRLTAVGLMHQSVGEAPFAAGWAPTTRGQLTPLSQTHMKPPTTQIG